MQSQPHDQGSIATPRLIALLLCQDVDHEASTLSLRQLTDGLVAHLPVDWEATVYVKADGVSPSSAVNIKVMTAGTRTVVSQMDASFGWMVYATAYQLTRRIHARFTGSGPFAVVVEVDGTEIGETPFYVMGAP